MLSICLMRKESFLLAGEKIKGYFENKNQKAYTTHDISEIFEEKKEEWAIANYRSYLDFIKYLETSGIFSNVKLKHLTTGSIKQILTKSGVENMYVAQTIKKEGYLSNYSAMYIHQLTLQIPKSIYISFDKYEERNSFNESDINLEQDAIDKAFSKPQRITSEVYKSELDGTRYFFLQKKSHSSDFGIINENGLSFTDLERTLIDIAIRPSYSGGVFEVLEAYRSAISKVDISKLNDYLCKFNYVYPYHQLIGFYLEKAGYDISKLKPFFDKKSNLNFYLTYNMTNKNLDYKWGVYYPTGF